MVWEPQRSCVGKLPSLRIGNESRCDDTRKRTNLRNIRARLVIWIATRIVMMIDRSLQLPQELDEI